MKYTLSLFLPICLSLALACPGIADIVGGRKLFKFQNKKDFAEFRMVGARWDNASTGIAFDKESAEPQRIAFPTGLIESPDIAVGFPSDQFVVSWNAITPPGSYLTVYLQVRSGGVWSRRFTVCIWNRDNRPVQRMSVNGQKDDIAEMDSDTLMLKKPADAFRVSAKLSSQDGQTYPVLQLLTVHAADTKVGIPGLKAHKSVWGKELPVPEVSQLTVPDGNRFCSATSTTMVLNYWAQKMSRPELAIKLQTAVDGIYDKEWGGTGNWTFNTAYAGEFGGLKAYVTRLASVSQAEEWIAKGVPVIVSIDYNIIRRRENKGRAGHLMVLRGFDEKGDCIINDPYTKLDQGESVRRVFAREDLERSWLLNKGSYGTVYLIYPDGWKVPENRYSNW